jgi:hypothetical protein
MPPGRRESGLAAALAPAVAVLLAGTQIFPLDGLVEMGTDYGQFVWNMWAVDTTIAAGRNPLFTDWMFHPEGSSLAAHVLVPGYWPVTALVRMVLGRDDLLYPLVAYRLSILVAFSVLTFGTWSFLRRIGATPLATLSGTLAYAFSSFVQFHAPHLNHLATAATLPLLGLALVVLWDRTSPDSAPAGASSWPPLLAAVFLIATGPYFGELIVFAWLALLLVGALAVFHPSTRPDVLARLRGLGPKIGVAALGAIVLASPFGWAWTQSRAEPMPSRQAWFWSANVLGFVIPDPQYQQGLAAIADTAGLGDELRRAHAAIDKGVSGREVFISYSLLVGALLAIRRGRPWILMCLIVAAVFVILSLGPALKLGGRAIDVSLPYAWLSAVPPFSMGRTPVRSVLFALFFLTIPSTLAWSAFDRQGRPGRIVATLAALVAAFGAWSPRSPAPAFVSPLDLSKLVPGEVCNIPLSTVDGFAVLLQTQHRRKIVTGLVSRRSEAQARDINHLGNLLDTSPRAFAAELFRRDAPNVILGPGAPRHLPEALAAAGLNVIDLRSSRGKLQ